MFVVFISEENNWSASDQDEFKIAIIVSMYLVHLNSCLNPILYVFMCDEYKKKLKQSLLLVLETAFHENHLDFKQMQMNEQGLKTKLEWLDVVVNSSLMIVTSIIITINNNLDLNH